MVSLLELMQERWETMQADLDELRREVRQATLNARTVSAVSDPVYAAMADLPTGALGWRATVIDSGAGSPAALWHDGVTWRKVDVT